jgi:hypothetical protein
MHSKDKKVALEKWLQRIVLDVCFRRKMIVYITYPRGEKDAM